MNNLQKLFRKKNKLIVGLMSGTSADGIDAALVRVSGEGLKTRFRLLAFTTVPYPDGLKKCLRRNSHPGSARLDEVARLNVLIGEFFAEAVTKVVHLAGKRIAQIDLIGSHGQTIAHYPEPRKVFGKKISATLQIGDPSVIAKRTGIVTVGDFRIADVAVGGSGAPLVPYVDYLLFRSRTRTRALLNIGGIANATVLPRNCSLDDVFAFDTGPGNMIVDALVQRFYRRPYDKDGKIAQEGKVISHLLAWLMRHRYLAQSPPKSTGREKFGEDFVEEVIRRSSSLPRHSKEDIITTVTAFTALSVYDAYVRFIRPRTALDELFVSGGGARNPVLMEYLRRLFGSEVRVSRIETVGMPSDAKEAVCFALLANETIAGNPANVPRATGAKRSTVLGKICLP